jgi:serine/threonine protein kinase
MRLTLNTLLAAVALFAVGVCSVLWAFFEEWKERRKKEKKKELNRSVVYIAGTIFLVYEDIGSVTLAAHVAAVHMDETIATRIFQDIVSGMAYLHQHDLTHGNLASGARGVLS